MRLEAEGRGASLTSHASHVDRVVAAHHSFIFFIIFFWLKSKSGLIAVSASGRDQRFFFSRIVAELPQNFLHMKYSATNSYILKPFSAHVLLDENHVYVSNCKFQRKSDMFE